MNIRFFLILLICSFLPLSQNLNAADEPNQETLGFPERLNQAYRYGRLRQFNKSTPAFEELLRTNPNEFVVYDFYVQTLDAKGDYSAAIRIYEEWLPKSKGNGSGNPDEIAEKISRLKKKEVFKTLMAQAEPWENAKISGTVEFSVKSNVPKEYQDKILSQMREILRQERKLLEEIFGYPIEDQPSMKVFIAGSLEDYEKLLRQFRPGEERVYAQGSYLSEARNMVIFFDGDTDITLLAHEVAHHLIYNYINNPSMLFNEGLAEYLSYKLTKVYAKTRILDNIQLVHWLHDQGEWQGTVDIFRMWQDYMGFRAREVFLDLEEVNQFDETSRMFYMGAWTLTYFFTEGGDEFFSDFFRKYLAHEMKNEVNDFNTTTHFFDSNLTPDEVKAFDNKWVKFVLDISYDKI